MSFYYGVQQQQQQPNHTSSHNNHHGGRSRRQPRMSSQNSHRQFRGVRSMKELGEAPAFSAFRTRFEACKGFELDDDLEFCPGLLTEDDLHSIPSSSSDRSSLSSGSPRGSPVSHPTQPTQISPPFSNIQPYLSYGQHQHMPSRQQQHQSTTKIHQPSALRTRSAIPIVDPSTMQRVNSPPTSISPANRMQNNAFMRRPW